MNPVQNMLGTIAMVYINVNDGYLFNSPFFPGDIGQQWRHY